MRNNTRVRPLISILITLSLLVAACEKAAPPEAAGIVLINGGIYTVDQDRSWAEAAAVRDGLIVAVGSNAQMRSFIGDNTAVVDLEGRMAMPGMHDSHIHPLEGGYEQVWCSLADADSVAAVIETLRDCPTQDGEWFNALGLDLALFGLAGPDRSILEGVELNRYVFIDAVDGHAALVNEAALELAGIDADTPDPVGGVIERRKGNREPSGTVRETARDIVDKLRPPRSVDVGVDVMRNTVRLMNSLGITSIIDLWAGEHEWQIYRSLDQSGDLTLRVVNGLIDEGVFEKHSGADFERVLAARHDYESARIENDSIKIMVDGVFEGETAAVLDRYKSADHFGVLNHERDNLQARVLRYFNMGLQIHFHTMGDRAARAALDALAYARANGSSEHRKQRHSLSHLGLIDPEDMPRFAKLNAAASFTAVWAMPGQWTVNLETPTLGQERVDRMWPIRSASEGGAVVVGGSDWNYGDLNPLMSIEAGVTRQDPYGPSEYKSNSDQGVSLATMIDAYTINGAWLANRDDRAGSIEIGKQADIVVFDRNLFEIEPDDISEAVVDLTMFEGRVVYDRGKEE